MSNIWFLTDRVKGKYHTKVFRTLVKECGSGLKVLGKIDVRTTNVTLGSNVTVHPWVMCNAPL